MGFDLTIEVRYMICEMTGRLYSYSRKDCSKIYGAQDLNIPEQWWKYVRFRGRIFRSYIDYFENESKADVDISEFQEYFPSWETVKSSVDYEDGWEYEWTEKNHNEFKEFIDWLVKQDTSYFVSWC
jgi:hypothetical protein